MLFSPVVSVAGLLNECACSLATMSSPLTQDGGQLLAIYIFFLVLCTVAVGLRLYVRFKLSKNYIGLDDALLTLTYVS